MAAEQSIMVHIPLQKMRWKPSPQQTINKIELTLIDKYLTCEQRKQIAKFYRDEAARHTRYNLEPSWNLPPSIQAIKTSTPAPIQATKTQPTQDPDIPPDNRETVNSLLVEQRGSYSELKQKMLTNPSLVRNQETMSNTQIKRQLYKEKTKYLRQLKKLHHHTSQ
ncbi:Uncharacterized protein FWK35_00036938 [Aphis craccivora]|uniref:Uncharacterized protein n=1 Tax=Aphis craccivora TaxID=307492 RepID=A0A6G0W3P1_APHCR|nr:Uncharacterized protein FWK35_00036938 [Aphis craccivora]